MEVEYKLTNIFQRETGVDRVFRPVLPEEERKRRERAFLDAAARFLLEIERERQRDPA